MGFSLKTKDQVLNVFKTLHVKVERKIEKYLKCVQIDNSGEYRGPFEEYYICNSIRLEKIVPKIPQQNGAV